MHWKNKFHAQKIVLGDGQKFDSKREYARYLELKKMEEEHLIEGLERQVPFVLIPAHRGKYRTERSVQYVADFAYTMCGEWIVEDVKGYRTPEYILKRKMMLDKYNISIKEVT